MITEFLLSTGLVYGYRYLTSPKRLIKKEWNKLMLEHNLTYNIVNIITKEYGCDFIISLNNDGFEKLEKMQDILQTIMGAKLYINQNINYSTATINVLTTDSQANIKFTPVKTQPYELYISKSEMGENLITNMAKFPHILDSGQTGCGKTEQIRIMLTNQIYFHSSRDINLYFSDLSDVADYEIFKKCKQTKGYAKNIHDSLVLFKYMEHLYSKRLGIFATKQCKNITEYNTQNYEKRMPYIYLVLDEFADYFPINKQIDNYIEKQQCYNILRALVRKTRKVGIFLLIGIQRPDTTVLDPSLRSGLCTKLAFSQNSNASSLTVCDSNELTNIENRKALFMMGNTREWFKSLDINDKIIKKYIKDSFVYHNSDFNKFLNNNIRDNVPRGKKPQLTDQCQEAENTIIPTELHPKKTRRRIKLK